MNKRILLSLFFFFVVLSTSGQIAVESFRLLESDLTAITNGTQEIDQNGEVAALIKVVTTQTGFTFDGGMLGIVRVVQQPAEIWVYVPRKLQKISIAHPDLGMLRDYYFPIPIDGGRTYELRMNTGQMTTIIKKKITATSELTIRVTPADAVLFLDGELQRIENGVFKKTVSVGQHDYRIEAVGFRSVKGTVDVKEGRNDPLDVKLVSTMSILTLTCPDAEAELLLNGESKGRERWQGTLSPGKYIVEARRPRHASSIEEIEVGELEELTVSVAAPTPLYGGLHVESEPGGAMVYVDDEPCGTTPCDVTNLAHLLVGEHQVKVVKENYDVFSTTIILRQDETYQLSNIRLTQSAVFTIDSHPEGVQLFINDEFVGRTPYTDTFFTGEYQLRLVRRKYESVSETVELCLSDLNPTFTLRQKGFQKNSFYIGAEAQVGGIFSAVGVVGAYVQGVNAEFRYRYPLQNVTQTAYFNSFRGNGEIEQPTAISIQSKSQLAGMLGYGILFSRRSRLTPAIGIGYAPITGEMEKGSLSEQKTYVLSGIVNVKAEFALSPFVSVIASPEYGFPFRKSTFIEVFEPACPKMKTWYGGFGLNIGIHLNL